MTVDRRLVRIERDGEWTVFEQDRVDPLFNPVVTRRFRAFSHFVPA